MKLTVKNRLAETKKEINEMRKGGNIPAILYAKNHPNRLLEISGTEFHAHMRVIQKGVFQILSHLEDEKGETLKL